MTCRLSNLLFAIVMTVWISIGSGPDAADAAWTLALLFSAVLASATVVLLLIYRRLKRLALEQA
jgi:hypothetical protein